jgi:hypothetical protein
MLEMLFHDTVKSIQLVDLLGYRQRRRDFGQLRYNVVAGVYLVSMAVAIGANGADLWTA